MAARLKEEVPTLADLASASSESASPANAAAKITKRTDTAVYVPLWVIIVTILHVFALYALWTHLENHLESYPEMLVFAVDAQTGLAIGWHQFSMLAREVHVALATGAVAVFLILFLRFVPLARKMPRAKKTALYRLLYAFLTLFPLLLSGAVTYMYFTGIACERYSALVLLLFLVVSLSLLILFVWRLVRLSQARKTTA